MGLVSTQNCSSKVHMEVEIGVNAQEKREKQE